VVGSSFDSSGANHAVLFDDGEVIDLGVLPGKKNSFGLALNNGGRAVGESLDPIGNVRATLFRHGKVIDLGALPGGQSSMADGINDHDAVVGSSTSVAGNPGAFPIPFHAALFEHGKVVELGSFMGVSPAADVSTARSINDGGLIVGSSVDSAGNTRAVLWTPREHREESPSHDDDE
jgi:probable HAF family extracellular repeat protein